MTAFQRKETIFPYFILELIIDFVLWTEKDIDEYLENTQQS